MIKFEAEYLSVLIKSMIVDIHSSPKGKNVKLSI